MFRVLLRLRKGEQVRYIGHLDLMRSFEHAIRRAHVPVVYSSGFNPRPKMHFGGALGVGVTSEDEWVVLDLTESVPAAEIMARLNEVLPAGIQVLGAEDLPEGVKSPLSKLNAAVYRITLRCPEELDGRAAQRVLDEMLSAAEVKVMRQRNEEKEVDIRPHILGIEIEECSDGKLALTAALTAGSSGGGRPQDLIKALIERLPGLGVENIHKIRSRGVED